MGDGFQQNIFQVVRQWSVTFLMLFIIIVQLMFPKPGDVGFDPAAFTNSLIWFLDILFIFYLGFALLEYKVTDKYNKQYGNFDVLDCEVTVAKNRDPLDYYHVVEKPDLLAITAKDMEAIKEDPLYDWCKQQVILEETIRRLANFLSLLERGQDSGKGIGKAAKLLPKETPAKAGKPAKGKQKDNPDQIKPGDLSATLMTLVKEAKGKKLTEEKLQEIVEKTQAEVETQFKQRQAWDEDDLKAGIAYPRTFIYYARLRIADSFPDYNLARKKARRVEFHYIVFFLPALWNTTFNFHPGYFPFKGYKIGVKKAKAAFVKVCWLEGTSSPVYKCTYCSLNNEGQMDEIIDSKQLLNLELMTQGRMIMEQKHDLQEAETEIRKFEARSGYFQRKYDDVLQLYEEDVTPQDSFAQQIMRQMADSKQEQKVKRQRAWIWGLALVAAIVFGLCLWIFVPAPVIGGG